MATVYSLVCENGSSGSYWSNLSADDRLRYGPAGSERVYDSLAAWSTARSAASDTSLLTEEVCEIGDAFTETQTEELDLSFPMALCKITTQINGVRTEGFHQGVIGAGYILDRTRSTNGVALPVPPFSLVDGFTVRISATGYNPNPISLASLNSIARRMIAIGNSRPFYGFGVTGALSSAEYCLAVGFTAGAGFNVSYLNQAQTIKNCIAVKNKYGFNVSGSDFHGFFYNNIALGNTTENWEAATLKAGSNASNNMGESDGNGGFIGGTPWTSGTNPNYAITSDSFVNYGGSTFSYSDDFRAASSAAPQVGAGTFYYGLDGWDLQNNPVPSYNPTGEENVDIGCYEYDHGYGLAPKTVSIEISGIITGSDLAIYKSSDNTEIVAPTTISGTNFSTTYSYTGDTTVTVKIRNASGTTKYKPYTAQGVIGENGLSMIVAQIEDPIAS